MRLSPYKYCSLEKTQGKVHFHLRHYKKSGTEFVVNGKREVSLDKLQMVDLISFSEAIHGAFLVALGEKEDGRPILDDDGMIDDDPDYEEEVDEYHIGNSVWVRVQASKAYVDMREFYFKTDEEGKELKLPSPKGITLFRDEFDNLLQALQDVTNIWRGLKEMTPCSLTHQNQEGFLLCPHCSPKQCAV